MTSSPRLVRDVMTRTVVSVTPLAGSTLAKDLMTAPAVTVGPGATLSQAARLMAERHIKRLLVVDPDGTLQGIVSRTDLLRVFLRPDSELVDEIRREVVGRLFPLAQHRVRVDVHHGVVTLSGGILDASLIPVAARLARAVEGVVDVNCALTPSVARTAGAQTLRLSGNT
ncbi:CBS domain-containing protein [Streptomyces sp. NBC_01298]|uniref:CBS domain-containing protein n=1 Tax=Streptomyces sp. NBC_01298 TaxID=2903817 RepID=UPI002E118E24|nr:CBS domain-containing protein [Streptomyces sp. NBC_01298]